MKDGDQTIRNRFHHYRCDPRGCPEYEAHRISCNTLLDRTKHRVGVPFLIVHPITNICHAVQVLDQEAGSLLVIHLYRM